MYVRDRSAEKPESVPNRCTLNGCDTASAALSHMRDHGLLSLGEEFRRDERRKLVVRGRERRASIGELYEGASSELRRRDSRLHV
jgi:hypothetical protein